MYELLWNITYYGFEFLLLLTLFTFVATNNSVRYRIKFLFYIILCAIMPTVCLPLMLLRIRDWRNALGPAWGVTKVAKFLGISFRVRGKENILKNTGCVVLINHQSSLDVAVLGELWLIIEKCTVIAKREILYFGTFGLATWLWGTVFIDRRKSEQAQDTINSTAKIIQTQQTKLLLFPEGRRHSGTSLEPFKKGAFHVAIAAQVPIQPVVVSRYYFLGSKPKRFDSGVSYITILPAIPTAGMTKEDLPALMEHTYEVMNKVFQESSQETLNDHFEQLQR